MTRYDPFLLAHCSAHANPRVYREICMNARRLQQRIACAREEEARRRASEERMQIARELHDVLGHNISLISVQAGVALHLMAKQPEQARVALWVIRDASKEALREMRSVLDALRQANEEAPRSPSPGLARLSDFISRASEAGLQVRVEVLGNLKGCPPVLIWQPFESFKKH